MSIGKRWTRRIVGMMAVLDLVVFGGWIAHEERVRAGDRIELPLEGYDPRDLLSGHYVSFRLVAAREAAALAPADDKTVSVCLERGDDGHHHATRLRAPGDACTPYLTGERDRYGAIDFGVDRFYVDERQAGEVGFIRAGHAFLVVTTDASGAAHPLDLVVDGRSFRP